MEIPELEKPAGKWCRYCAVGKGCRIYQNRPLPCQEFRCEWLKGFGQRKDRPDRTKVIPDFVKIPDSLFDDGLFQIWEVARGKLNTPYTQYMTKYALAGRIWVLHIPLEGPKLLFVPRGETLTLDIRIGVSEAGWEIGQL
jgi:hypothetical protein